MLCRVLCVLLFLAWTTERAADEMYWGNWRSIFAAPNFLFESVPGVHLMTWQLLLLALGPLCLLLPGAFRRRAWPMDAAIFTSLGAIAFTFAWGVARGGSAYQSYYQLHWFVTALYIGLLLMSILGGPADLKAIGKTILAAALVRATLATYFYLFYVRGRNLDPWPEYITSHDDSLLFTAAIIVTLAWAIARRRASSWLWFGVVFLWIAAGMKANNRRIAWLELIAMLVFAYLLLPRRSLMRRRANRLVLLAAPVLALYVGVGWGRGGAIFAPVRAIATNVGEQENTSSIARHEENLNLVWTYLKSPLLGLGWGHTYREASSTYTRGFGPSFYQYGYLPHNSMVALATFAGLPGLAGIWLVVPVTAFLATRAYRHAARRTDAAAAMAALCYLPAYAVHAYGDIGFESFTGCLLLGVALGVAGELAATTGAWPTASARRMAKGPARTAQDGETRRAA